MSTNNDDPFAELLNQHKEQQIRTDSSSNINNSERHSNNNYSNRSRGRGGGRSRGGHFNRGGSHHHQGRGGFKRPREEDAEEIRSKYLSRIKLDTPEDIAKWIADRKKNFPGRVNNEEENGRPNNPLGLIQDYSSSEESEIEEDIKKSVAVNDSSINKQVEKFSDIKGGDDQVEINNTEETNSNKLLSDEAITNENIQSVDNSKNNNEEVEDEEIDEAPEFQTSQQTFQPSTSAINQSDKTVENAVEDTTPICKYFSNGQRCFKGQKCPYLHIKSEKTTKPGPNHKPQQSQYKRKDLINLLQAQDIEKDSEIILQSLRYLFNNGYLN